MGFKLLPEVFWGAGSLKQLADVLRNIKAEYVLVVTDQGIVKAGIADKVISVAKEVCSRTEIFDQIEPDPKDTTVAACAAKYKNDRPDAIVAVGGGSCMDFGKAVNVLLYNDGTIQDYKNQWDAIPNLTGTLVTIPTTAGTAAEVTINYVITDVEKKRKFVCVDPHDMPIIAVVDPEMMSSMPKGLTASTGMDALTHAVEAYIGNSTTIDTRRDALKAVKLIFENIDIAYEHGDNIQARRNMLHASFYAGCAFTKSYVGYVHAVAHSLGGQYNVPHGLANAILLPLVLREYGSCIDKKLHRLAIAAGLADKNTPDHEATELFIRAIEEMKERFGIVNIVKEIQETDIPKLAHYADKEANPLYPVPKLMGASELEKFYYMLMSLTSKENTSEAEK